MSELQLPSQSNEDQLINTTSSDTFGTLPPRKRAKTDEEKEQRRIERILRNRRAAHASREKKRRHVEHLEDYVVDLESSIKSFESNEISYQEIQKQLIAKLSANNIDYSDIDLSLPKNVEKVERPKDLDLTAPATTTSTTTTANKKQRLSKVADKKKYKKTKITEIPSPSFEEDLSSEDEDMEDQEEADPEETEIKVKLEHDIKLSALEESSSKKRKAEDQYLSPPSSTSPSKLRLNDEHLFVDQEYSNLFDDDDMLLTNTDSLELFKQDDSSLLNTYIKQEDSSLLNTYIKQEEDTNIFKQQDIIPTTEVESNTTSDSQLNNTNSFSSNANQDLCSFNVVHHPAVMIV